MRGTTRIPTKIGFWKSKPTTTEPKKMNAEWCRANPAHGEGDNTCPAEVVRLKLVEIFRQIREDHGSTKSFTVEEVVEVLPSKAERCLFVVRGLGDTVIVRKDFRRAYRHALLPLAFVLNDLD